MSYNALGKFHCFKVVFYQLDCDPRIYALGKATIKTSYQLNIIKLANTLCIS